MCLANAKGHNTAEVGFEPRPLAPESDTLTIRPPRPPLVITDNVMLFTIVLFQLHEERYNGN